MKCRGFFVLVWMHCPGKCTKKEPHHCWWGESKGSARFTDVCPLFRLRLPFVFIRMPHGKLHFTLDIDRITDFLDITPMCVERLRRHFGPKQTPCSIKVEKKEPVDYGQLAAYHQKLIDSRGCRNRADVARRFGKSRVWVTKVMKKESAKGPCRNLRRDATKT
jgi:hypothetical protein